MTIAVLAMTVVLPCCRHEKQNSSQFPGFSPRTVSGMPNAADTISLGFYNVENLFGLADQGNEYPEFRPGSGSWNKQLYEIKVERIASVIAAMHLDIIGLSEVQNKGTLRDLQQETRRLGVDYPYSAIADEPGKPINCPALLSRFPIVENHGFRSLSPLPTRNILEARVDCNGPSLRIYVNHWPAKFQPESERIAAAQALAQAIVRYGAGVPYVIIGNLNSDYDEWRTFRTRGLDDTKGITGLNTVLGTIFSDSTGSLTPVSKTDLCRDVNHIHFDPWLDMPPEKRMSMSFRGTPETPDHILLPRELVCGSTFTYCDSSFTAFRWDGRLLRSGEPFGWQERGFGKHRFFTGEGYSDHLPVFLRLVERRGSPRAQQPDSPAAGDHTPPRSAISGETGQEWLPGGTGFTVTYEPDDAATGRRCLCVKGAAPEKNCVAAQTVMRLPLLNRSRRSMVTFDIRGSGKIQFRMKSGHGKWRFYTGEKFRYYKSSRYLLSQISTWRHETLEFLADDLAAPDLRIELRAGKDEPFCVHLENFTVE